MSKGVIKEVAGAAEIAAGVAMDVGLIPGGKKLGDFLIASGAGLVLSGIGTMMSKGSLKGFATTVRDPVAPWEIVYGRQRVGGAIVYPGIDPQGSGGA